jgi:hexosaminidase
MQRDSPPDSGWSLLRALARYVATETGRRVMSVYPTPSALHQPERRCGVLLLVFLAMNATAEATSPVVPLKLRWEVTEHVGAGRELHTEAALELTNLGTEPLPPAGWAIHFNCLAGLVPGPVAPDLNVESLGGTYYRLVPAAGFAGLAPQSTVRAHVRHPGLVIGDSSAPQGPFLVRAETPGEGILLAVNETAPRLTAVQRPPLEAGRYAPDPAATYAANAEIADLPLATLPPFLPRPSFAERGTGEVHLRDRPRVRATGGLAAARRAAEALLDRTFAPGTRHGGPPLVLETGPVAGLFSREGYALSIDQARGIRIRGQTRLGVLRGLASLSFLMPLPGAAPAVLPALEVRDEPRFSYRGLQIDVARNFQSPAIVRRTLDLMARLKLNALHLHLSDDEGWRLAIDGLPELTEFGGRRGHAAVPDRDFLPPAHGSGPDPRDVHGSGFYSRAEFIGLLRYANDRGIAIVPEFDMPGHARAAIKAMEFRQRRLAAGGRADAGAYLLSDPSDRSRYLSDQGHDDNALNPALESTYAFIEKVFASVAAIYREAGVEASLVHVGGDELPAGVWEGSPVCAERAAALGLARVADLKAYFARRLVTIARAHGLAVAGWEQFGLRAAPAGGAPPAAVPDLELARDGVTLYVWSDLAGDEDIAYRLANAGYRIVLAGASHLYLDMAHEDVAEEPGLNWAPAIPLRRIYDFVPMNSAWPSTPATWPTAAGRARIDGIEAELFGETLRGEERIDYLLMPRLVAVAERAWSPEPGWVRLADPLAQNSRHREEWSVFMNQLSKQVLSRLDLEGVGIRYRVPPPGLVRLGGVVRANHAYPGYRLRYTTDGSNPTLHSPELVGEVPTDSRLAVAAFTPDGRAGRTARIEGSH